MTTAHLAHLVGGNDSHGGPLVRLLEAAGFQVAHHASADQFLQTTTEAAPRGLVLELHMQSMNAPQLRSLLGERQTDMPLIVISEDGDATAGSPSAGKTTAVDVAQSAQPLVRAQLIAAFRGALMPFDESGPLQQQRQQHHARLGTLTRREREVLEGLVKGRLNKQIAAEMGTSERTVKAHRQQVMRKMHAASLAALVAAMTRY